jgi:hypothetical protein
MHHIFDAFGDLEPVMGQAVSDWIGRQGKAIRP